MLPYFNNDDEHTMNTNNHNSHDDETLLFSTKSFRAIQWMPNFHNIHAYFVSPDNKREKRFVLMFAIIEHRVTKEHFVVGLCNTLFIDQCAENNPDFVGYFAMPQQAPRSSLLPPNLYQFSLN